MKKKGTFSVVFSFAKQCRGKMLASVLLDDETREICKEIVSCNALDRVFIATDYFDASINRISAWVTGVRNVQEALLNALLMPHEAMREMQESGAI